MFEPKWTPTTYERIPYAPHNSTAHDERCDCPWCMPGEPDEQPAPAWEDEWERLNDEREAMESFLAVPSYVERYRDAKQAEQAMEDRDSGFGEGAYIDSLL
jgi:hypothetical protein